jgi:hypothetical protein
MLLIFARLIKSGFISENIIIMKAYTIRSVGVMEFLLNGLIAFSKSFFFKSFIA